VVKDPLPDHRLSLEAIAGAAASIDPVFLQSPQYESSLLSENLGCRLILKVETANPIRSFKGRGAGYFVSSVVKRGDQRRLVCASTGNFGLAMAYACDQHRRPLTVFADIGANRLKTNLIEDLGADVKLSGKDFDAAKDLARSYSDEVGAWMVEDGREPEISEGAGTIGVELTQTDRYDALLIPVGNGALISGVARWVKAISPDTIIIGVSATGADAMARSLRSSGIIEREHVDTIAEGIAVRTPVPEAVEDMRPIVDEMILVDDHQMIDAMKVIHTLAGQLVEPSGAVGVAAIAAEPEHFAGLRLATILTGNNLTDDQISLWLGDFSSRK
jgi:threonine dehydratase